MTLAANDRFVSIAASPGQTVLNYDFRLTRADGMTVVRIRAGVETTLTFGGGGFSFPSGLGGAGGGSLTLASAAIAGDVYQLVGIHPEDRLSDYLSNRALDTPKLNADGDATAIVQQEHRRDIGRAIKAGYGQAGPDWRAATSDRLLTLTSGNQIQSSETPANEKTYREEADKALQAQVDKNAADIKGALLSVAATLAYAQLILSKAQSAGLNLIDADFGADPTGVKDSTLAIQKGIDVLSASHGGKLIVPFGTYRVDSQLTLKDRVQIEFRDAVINFNNLTNFAYLFRGPTSGSGPGTLGTAYATTADVNQGDRYLNTTLNSGLQRGDYAFLVSDAEWSNSPGFGLRGEILRVADIFGDRIFFVSPAQAGYATADNARIMKVTPLRDVQLTGSAEIFGAANYTRALKFGQSVNVGASGTVAQTFLEARNAVDLVVAGLTISDFHSQGCIGINVVNGVFEDLTIENMIANASNGYGLAFGNASQQCSIQNNRLRLAGRHPVGHGTYSLNGLGLHGITRGLTYRGNDIQGSGGAANAIDVHPGADDVAIVDNVVWDSALQGILCRARKLVAKGNRIKQSTQYGIHYTNDTVGSGHCEIEGNTIEQVRQLPKTLICGTDGNGRMMLPGERITQLAASRQGVVVSHLQFGGQNNIGVIETTSTFVTGSSQVQGEASGATVFPINSIQTETTPKCYGIRINGGAAGTMRGGIVSGNFVDMTNSPVASLGMLVENGRSLAITGNAVILPDGADDGVGIKLDTCTKTGVTQNNLRVFGTNVDAIGVVDTGGSGNVVADNIEDSF